MGTVRDARSEPRSDIVCLEGNEASPSHFGDGFTASNVMHTLNGTEANCVCYAIGSYSSNSWKSSNPYSGVYETEIAKTIDNMNGGYPGCQQGGVVVIEIHQP